MKTIRYFLVAVAVAVAAGLCVAVAQDAPKPPPGAPPPPPAPDAAKPNASAATPPASSTPDGRHGERHGEHHAEGWHRPPMPPVPLKPTPYIGVITTPPPAVLSAQLGLSEGFGLVVSDVLPDSPAATAGIQRYDVLTKFNDQELIDSSQLSTLVRALKKDAEASVTLIRKAAPQTVTVKIGERPLPEHHGFPGPGNFRTGGPAYPPGDFDKMGWEYSRHIQDEARHLQERAQYYSQKLRDYQDRMKAWQKNPSTEMPKLPELPPADAVVTAPSGPSADSGPSIAPEDILREVHPGGPAQIRVVQPNATVTYNMANAKLVMRDEKGEIEMTTHDGKRTLVARNAQGDTIFDGPIDTEEQRKALPEEVRKKLELAEQQRKLAETQPPQFVQPVPEVDVQ